MSKHGEAFRALGRHPVDAAGTLPRAERARIRAGEPADDALGAFAQKVRRWALDVTDEDIAALRAEGRDEDAIFEAIVCAAIGAGMSRYDAGLRALEGGER